MNQKLTDFSVEDKGRQVFLDYQREDSSSTRISIVLLKNNRIGIGIDINQDGADEIELNLVGNRLFIEKTPNNSVEGTISAEREIMYGVGIEKQEGEIGMTHGPFKTLKEALEEFPCQNSVIVKFDKEKDIILFRAEIVIDANNRTHNYIWQEV